MAAISSDQYRAKLQASIDNLLDWSTTNRPNLNAAKTYHVSFHKSLERKINSVYYIGSTIIARKSSIKDLGVTFDNKLKFNDHIQDVQKRIHNMKCVSWRFTRELKSTQLTRRLHDSYILPIAEYGSCVWGNRIASSNDRLEAVQRNITRTILRTAYRPNMPRYVPFHHRLYILNTISYTHRREIASMIFVIKIMMGLINSSLAENIQAAKFVNVRNTRNTSPFDLAKIRAKQSPLFHACTLINMYKDTISMDLSIDSITKALRLHNLESYSP